MGKVSEILVDRLVEVCTQDKKMFWDKPYLSFAINWFSKYEYRGINAVLLAGGEWITVNQLKKYNEAHKEDYWFPKGTKSNCVLFAKILTAKEADRVEDVIKDDTDARRSFMMRYTRVYPVNAMVNSKGEHLKLRIGNDLTITYTEAQTLVDRYCKANHISIHNIGGTPCFSEATRSISLPPINAFKSEEAYFRVLFHEMAHSTGTKECLARPDFEKYSGKDGSRNREELVAEMTSLLLATECGFSEEIGVERSEAYVQGWCSYFKDKPNEVISALSQAYKAKDYILSGTWADTELTGSAKIK